MKLSRIALQVPDPELARAQAWRLFGSRSDESASQVEGVAVSFAPPSVSTWARSPRARNAAALAGLSFECADLQAQRLRLARIARVATDARGATDEATMLAAADSGACTVEFSRSGAAAEAGPPAVAIDLVAIDLAALAPERLAAHWSQIFGRPVRRDAQGTPCLALDGTTIRFVVAGEHGDHGSHFDAEGGGDRVGDSAEGIRAIEMAAGRFIGGRSTDTASFLGIAIRKST